MNLKVEAIKSITKALPSIIPHLKGEATRLYCEHKALDRDPSEPGRDEKLGTERKIKAAILKRLKRQREDVVNGLNMNYKDVLGLGVYSNDDPAEYTELVKLVYDALLLGVLIAETEVGVSLGVGTVNEAALQYARTYVTEWVAGLDATTTKLLREALSILPSGTGTLADVVTILEPVFGSDRAWKIAVTETTRIYAEAGQIYGLELKRQYPNVKTFKRWYTNNDDRVCPICAPLNGKEVEIEDGFDLEVLNPPAHVNCRCWVTVTVKL